MVTLHFNELPLSARQRFVRAATTPNDPNVVRIEHGLPDGCARWVLLISSVIASLGLSGWLIQEGLRNAPIHVREIYALLSLALFVFLAIVFGIVFRRIWPPAPFRTGSIYALTSALVWADTEQLVIVPLSELDAPEITTELRNNRVMGHRLKMTSDFRLTMRFSSRPELDQTVARLASARAFFKQALDARDSNALAQIDPFVECTTSGVWQVPPTDQAPRIGIVPSGVRLFRWLGALALSIVLTGTLFGVMSALSAGD